MLKSRPQINFTIPSGVIKIEIVDIFCAAIGGGWIWVYFVTGKQECVSFPGAPNGQVT